MPQSLRSSSSIALAMLGMLMLAGCGDGKASHATEQVEGVVTLDGEPLAGATVTFVPVSQDQGTPATGTTDQQGRYSLTVIEGGATGKPGAGTVAGEYYVGVVKNVSPPGPESEDDPDYETYYEEGNQPEITYVVPKKYNNPRASDLKVTVQAGRNNIPIELSSQ